MQFSRYGRGAGGWPTPEGTLRVRVSFRANAPGPHGSPRRPGRARTSARALARSLKAEQHGPAAPNAHDEPLLRACADGTRLRVHQVESTFDIRASPGQIGRGSSTTTA
jgi:hypothetical protein